MNRTIYYKKIILYENNVISTKSTNLTTYFLLQKYEKHKDMHYAQSMIQILLIPFILDILFFQERM
jgi:hypothetical protein